MTHQSTFHPDEKESQATVNPRTSSSTSIAITDAPTEAFTATGDIGNAEDDHESGKKSAEADMGEAALDKQLEHLSAHEKQIIKDQLLLPPVKINYFSLYRYATTWDLVIIAVAIVASIAGGAAMPFFTLLFGNMAKTFQDVFIKSITFAHFKSELSKFSCYFVALGVAEFVLTWIATLGFIYTGEHITQKVREQYLAAILRQNIGFFDKLGSGEITTRITSDTNLIQDAISQKVSLTLAALGTFFTAFIIGYARFWKLALILTSTIVAIVLIMGLASRFIIKFKSLSIASAGQGSTVAEESLSSVKNATAFGVQEKLASSYEHFLHEAMGHGRKLKALFAFLIGACMSIISLNHGLGLWMGSRFLVDGETNLSQILTILMSIIMGAFSLNNVTPHMEAFTAGISAADKIYRTIARSSSIDPSSEEGIKLDKLEGNVELRDVKHIYPSRPDIVVTDNVNLFIPAGKTTALVGPSGSGKSTVVGLLERFYSPVRGGVYLDGHDIQTLNTRWLRQQMALVSQEPTLFATTISGNIRHGLIGSPFEKESEESIQDRVVNAAKMANAHDFISALPEGYETQVGQRGFLLSGGQKQRIAIARAIVSDPKVLLLDEATSALDTKSEGVVQAALDAASKGRTTIVIAHRLSTIRDAHNIIVLVDGRIIEQGTHRELTSKDGPYAKLVEAQHLNDDEGDNDDDDNEDMISVDLDGEKDSLAALEKKQTDLKPVQSQDSMQNVDQAASLEGQPKYSLLTLIKFIYSFNRPEKWLMFLGLLASVITGGCSPVQSVIFAKAISTLSLPPQMYGKLRSDANFWALMFLMLGIVQFFSYLVSNAIFGHCSESLLARSRSRAFRTYLRQDIAFFDRDENSPGSMTAFLSTDTTHLTGVSGATLGTLINVTVTLFASIIVALAIGWDVALVCTSIVPVMLACGFLRFHMLSTFEAKAKKAYEDSASYACEAISAIRTVASLTREDEVWQIYHAQVVAQAQRGLGSAIWSSMLYAASQGIMFFCVALGFWYGGMQLGKERYTMFQFFVCFCSIIFGAQGAGVFFSFAPDMGKARTSAAAFKKLTDRKPSIDTWSSLGDSIEKVDGKVEFKNVHFRYPNRPQQRVLRGLDLTIKPGQYAALVGASGCGKSTTIALLERFYDPHVGEVLIDGRNISRLNVNSYRKHVSLVSQEPTLYQGTIKENILLGIEDSESVSEEQLVEACKAANIYDFIISTESGFSTVVGSKGGMLSGGQKQRVAIARALVRNPKILLLDEATSALDSESEKVVQAALDRAAQGRTTIAVAHRLSSIQNADVIYVFDQGKIVEGGTHNELLQLKGRYYELVNMQSLDKQ